VAPRISSTILRARQVARRQRWSSRTIRTELDARAVLDHGCWFNLDAAERVERFFSRLLRTTDGEWAGKPFHLLPWQRDELIRPLFGWTRADGTRRYRRGGVWIPKKNGKSTLLAGIELYLFLADHEPVAEVYSAANDRAQAGIIYNHAARMVEYSPQLYARITEKGIIRSTKTIYDRVTGSVFRALSADAPTKEGLNIHGLIVDEIHAMRNRILWDTLIYGGASRRQPLTLSISTAGVYDVASIGWEQYAYARDIVKGTNDIDWSFFALIYEAPPTANWKLERTWKHANPSYGVTVKPDAFREECAEASKEPRKENAFRRYRLNQWVQQATRWIPTETWQANDVHPIDRTTLRGTTAYGGLDLGSVSDLTAFALLCQCPQDPDAVDVLMRFWIPEDTLADPHNRNAALYQQWVRDGLLSTTPGNSTDYDFIEAAILQDAETFNIRAIGLDRLFQGQQVANHLGDHGLQVVAVGQGFLGQGAPMKEFERLWRGRKVHHGNHPVLRWMADNVEVKQDPTGNLKIVKPNSRMDPRKVDGMTAIVNAVDQLARAVPAPPPPSYTMVFLGGRR
jgi:phage terminase large subunit-like protein